MQIVEHPIGDAHALMPAVLGCRGLTSIITQANHEVAAASAPNLDQLAAMPCGDECGPDRFRALLALEHFKSACGTCCQGCRVSLIRTTIPPWEGGNARGRHGYPLFTTSSKFSTRFPTIAHAASSLGFSPASGFVSPTAMSFFAASTSLAYFARWSR